MAATLSVAVSAGNDDAEERVSNGSMSRSSSDLELVHDGNREQLVGIRFQNVNLPAGSIVNSAYVQFTVDEIDNGATSVVVSGQAIGNAPTFSNSRDDISDRAVTAAAQSWTIAPWNSVGAAGPDQRTPDLTNIINEIISQGDWSSGNALALIISAAPGCNNSACQRTAESFNGVSASAPRLVIDYTIPNSVDLAVSQSDSPDPVNAGNNFSYTLTVTNQGTLPATGVTLTDTLPPGVSVQSVTPGQGTCTTGATVSCNIGDLPSGFSIQVNIIVTAPVSGTLTNTASVSANELDVDSANNTATETTTVTSNIQQLCYLVADSGGGAGGDDLLTEVDTAIFDPGSNETNIGTGTATSNIEAIAWNSSTQVLYAANANRLGVLSLASGTFSPLTSSFGTGIDVDGNSQSFTDVDGLAYDATSGILYGVHARSGDDALIQVDMTTGAHIPDAFGTGIDFVTIESVSGNTITDDIAVDPTTGTLYATVNSGGSSDRLVRINKFTGTVQDIAQITVPDIEGLGTDPSGQLWGTSGTQGILYEIDKNNGVGSFGRTIDNGSDYEAVDCYAISPSIDVDISVNKTVDNPAPLTGSQVSYTITAANTGFGMATSLQLTDILPGELDFVSATPSQGTFDSVSGNWFVGALVSGSSATLTLSATVNAGSATTVTNTAAVAYVSQNDPNSSNDSASVDIVVAGIALNKSASVDTDSISTSNPKAIPGAIVRYRIEINNDSSQTTDADTISIVDRLPPEVALLVNDPSGPVAFIDGSPASGLSYTFSGYASGSDDVEFSNDTDFSNGITWGYVPSTAAATDPNVTAIRISPQGTLNGTAGGGAPGFVLEYRTQVR